jgi:DNA-binding NarL/FixJ family response regulator
VTANELRKAEARYQRASARSEQLRRERNALILEALAAGWTHAQIAKATGMTRSRVGQLAKS